MEEGQPVGIFIGAQRLSLIHIYCRNKRIAWMSAMEILRKLDLTLDVSDDGAEAYCLSILDNQVQNASDVSIWFADHLMAIED